MGIFLSLFSLYAFIKTVNYGIFELKKNNNKIGFILVIAIAIFAIIFTNYIVWFVY